MNDNQNPDQNQAKIDELLNQARQIGQDIDKVNRDTRANLDEIRAEVSQTVAEIEAIATELGSAEHEADKQLEQLMQEHTTEPAQQ